MSTIGKDTLHRAAILHPDSGPQTIGETETIITTTGAWGNKILSSNDLLFGMGSDLIVMALFMALYVMYLIMGTVSYYFLVA